MRDELELIRIQRDLALRLVVARDLEEVAADLLEALARLDGVDAVGVYVSSAVGGVLRLTAHRGVSQQLVEAAREWRPQRPSAGEPVLGGRPVAVDAERMASDPTLEPLRREGLRSEVMVPVEAHGEVLLAAAAASRRLDRMPRATREAAEALALTAGQAAGRVRAEALRWAAETGTRDALRLQVELATALLASRGHDELLEGIADGILAVPWVDAAAVYVVDYPAGVARMAAHRRLPPELMPVVAEVSLDTPEAIAILRGEALYDHPDNERYLAPFRREVGGAGFVGRALVPVVSGDCVTAVLAAASRQNAECPPEVRAGLESGALHVGAALRRLDAEESLRRGERVLRRAQAMARLGSWRWDARSDEMWWSDEMFRIFGRARESGPPGIEFLTDTVHPEDREPDVQMIDEDAGRSVSNRFEQRIVRPDGSVATVLAQLEIETGPDGALATVLGVVQDLTEQRRIEDALSRRLRFERAIAAFSAELLEGRSGALDRVMRELLVFSDASRVYLFENFEDPDDGPCTRQIAEACAPGVAPQIDNPALEHCPWQGAGFERWPRLLGAGEAIQGLVEHMPPGERAALEQQGIVSMLVLPVFVSGAWWGFVGFDDTGAPRQWRDEDVMMLRTAAGLLGTFLERRRGSTAVPGEGETAGAGDRRRRP